MVVVMMVKIVLMVMIILYSLTELTTGRLLTQNFKCLRKKSEGDVEDDKQDEKNLQVFPQSKRLLSPKKHFAWPNQWT